MQTILENRGGGGTRKKPPQQNFFRIYTGGGADYFRNNRDSCGNDSSFLDRESSKNDSCSTI